MKFLFPIVTSIIIFSVTSCERSQTHELEVKNQKLQEKLTVLQNEKVALRTENQLFRERSAARARLSGDAANQVIFQTELNDSPGYKNDPFIGEKDGPVIAMVFTDFSCAPCAQFALETFAALMQDAKQNSSLRLIVRDFPLSSNKHSLTAAQFANCAGEQGKYWQSHEALFKNQAEVQSGNFEAVMRLVEGIDHKRLVRCVKSGRYEKEIAQDISDGRSMGAQGAPGVFIGIQKTEPNSLEGTFIRGAQPLAAFQRQIQKAKLFAENTKN